MVYVKKADRPQAAITDENQALLDEIAQLKREKAELLQTQVDAQPEDAMEYLKQQNLELMKAVGNLVNKGNTAVVDPGPLKRRADGFTAKAYVLTDERKAQVVAIFDKYEGKGVEYKFDDKSGSVTFRKKVKVRIFDKENEVWTREDAWKSESVHCSSSDHTINKLVRFLLLV